MSEQLNKILNVTRSDMPPFEDYAGLIKQLWESRHISNDGVLHNRLEEELSNYFGADNAFLFCNGHLALSCAMRVLNLSGEVITTPFTFASTTHAIVENGLTPVFCDIKKDDFTIDPAKIETLITDKTSAILGVHVYGNMCETLTIEAIAKKHSLKVIYDAAHAFGVVQDGKSAANFGDISMFSFHATKVFHTIEGGCLTFNDAALAEPLRRIKNFGMCGMEAPILFGINAKMNEFAAAMGLCNLEFVDSYIEKRKRVYESYQEYLPKIDGLRVFEVARANKHNYSYMPIVVDSEILGINRDGVLKSLKNDGINAKKYFYPLTSDFDCYKQVYQSYTPVAKKIAESVLCLPMYPDLELSDVKRISARIRTTLHEISGGAKL